LQRSIQFIRTFIEEMSSPFIPIGICVGIKRLLDDLRVTAAQIIDRVGPVAYKLELPDELRGIHNTFHVSNLKKCLTDENLIIPLEEIQLDDKLHFIEEPVEIMDHEVKQLNQSRIPIVKIEKCNTRIEFSKPQRETTYQVTLDALKLSPCYLAFWVTAKVPKVYMHQFWNTIKKIKDTDAYRFKLDKQNSELTLKFLMRSSRFVPDSPTKILLNLLLKKKWFHLSRNLGTLASVICYMRSIQIICISPREHVLLSSIGASLGSPQEDIMFQADNKEISSTRKENMPYPRFTKVIISHFISKDKTISMRNMINLYTVRDDSLLAIKDSKAYKIYLDFSTEKTTPKKERNFKKIASPLHKLTTVLEEEPIQKPKWAKKPEPTKQAKTAKKTTRAKKSCTMQTAGVVIRDTPGVSVSKKKAQAKVDRGKGIDLHSDVALLEAAQLKKVLKKSNGDDDDSNDDDNDNNSDDDDDEETTVVGHVNINQEGACNQVKDDAQATQKTEGPILSSSISSDYAAKYLNFDNIPSVVTKVVSLLDINIQYKVPRTSPLLTIPVFVIPEHTIVNPYEIVIIALSTTISSLRITNLEKDVKELKTVDHYATLLSTIKYEVLNAVKEYLGTSLDDALLMVLQKHSADITKEYSVPAEIQVPKETITSSDTTALIEFDHKTSLFETMTKSKSFNNSPKQRALYHALMESILKDEDVMDEGVADKLKKRKRDDVDKDEGLSARSDRTKSTVKSAQANETVFEAGDTQEPQNQGQDMGHEVIPVDYFINNDPEYLRGGSSSKKYTTSMTKTKAAKVSKYYVYSMKRIIAVTKLKVMKWYDYGYLEEIEVRREDQQLYKFKEGDFPRLHLYDIEDMMLLLVQNKLFNLETDVILTWV
ncbi:hypothetical protein Tco_1048533, partial [Tanacetum coccineum]